MPLEWSRVMERYRDGARVPTIAGGKFLQVTGVTDTIISIETPAWTAELQRQHLEQGVRLIEEGLISSDPGLFVEDYMLYVSKIKATSVAHILRDLGFLDITSTFTVRC